MVGLRTVARETAPRCSSVGRASIASASLIAALSGLGGVALGFGGELDPGFDGPGGDGNGSFNVQITAGNTGDSVTAAAIQPDGRIVVVGLTDSLVGAGSDTDFALARFNSDGTLDTSFGGDGIVTTKVAGDQDDYASGVAFQDDGKIVVAGAADTDPTATENFDFAMARYHPSGVLDTNADSDPGTHLDSDGIFTTGVGSAANGGDEATDVAVQPLNGKIVLAGYAEQAGADVDFGLVRINPVDGSLDTGFDGDATMPGFPGEGKVTTHFSGTQDQAFAIEIQSDARIVVAGADGADVALARYNASDGTLDTTFDGDGRVTTSFTAADRAFGLAIQADGKLVVAGNTGTSSLGFALARYDPADGSLDPAFDGDTSMPGFPGNGKVTTSFGPGQGSSLAALGVAVQEDGRIVAVGRTDVDASGSSDFDPAIARYNGADGTLDASFAGDGTRTDPVAPAPGVDAYRAVAVDADAVLAVGTASIPATGNDWILARYGLFPPETTINKGPKKKSRDRTPTFRFSSDEPGSAFMCKLDRKPYKPCSSPRRYKVGRGKHVFMVTATDSSENTDPTPAKRTFRVRRP